ncbi:NHL repeat-containing protein [Thermincola ferriacetica]|uniref:NHL repeat-containing protein n=1 Tax=Thermincola ferriacetica TaxID=281456 RepID=A0A0L6W7C6_9FIRM|nr:hypothetical protein [Thermincola ferriacetica]KNZ71004.1 NHL repeat-containing protein [Thermincola ferriacetica]
MAKKISRSTLLNIILGAALIVVLVFGYFYFKRVSPVEVAQTVVPANLPEYEFMFPIYGGEKEFNNPYEILAFNDAVYVSDSKNARIAVYDRTGKHLKDIVSKEMKYPAGMYWDGERLWVAEAMNHKVLVMNADGNMLDRISLDNKVLVADIAVNGNKLYLINIRAMRIEIYDLNTRKLIKSFGGIGKEEGKLYYPYDLTVRDGKLYVADSLNNRINIYDLDGKFIMTLPKRTGDPKKGGLSVPRGLAFDKSGVLYTVEGMAHRVTAINDKGEILMQLTKSQPLNEEEVMDITLPTDVTFDEVGRMYVLEHGFKRILVYKRK